MNDRNQTVRIKKEILIRLVESFFSDDFIGRTRLIPYDMRPKGSEVPYRCCIYKERAILKDRTIAGLGFSVEGDDERKSLSEYAQKALDRTAPEENPLTVIEVACKGCVPSQIYVTDLCQGCVARPCQSACKFGAISMQNGRSHIDGSKCKKCKMCMAVCPYNAIVQIAVPCEDACPVGAISKDESGYARIDFESCISCGKCVAACPFAAVHEKSQMIDILKNIKAGKEVIAMAAPSVVGQFPGNILQLKTAMLKAGFSGFYEVAQGADVTARNEAREFEERMENGAPFMTTSCCAGYHQLLEKHLPDMMPYVSDTKTPLYYTAELVKKEHPGAITVFVGPCVAKRKEGMKNKNIDFVMNFEELGALFIGRKIDVMQCEETPLDTESSRQGRSFCRTGGVADSIKALSDKTKPCIVNGFTKDSVKQLKKYAKDGKCEGCNIIEVMCCEGGCLGGNATINQIKTAHKIVEDFASKSKDISKE